MSIQVSLLNKSSYLQKHTKQFLSLLYMLPINYEKLLPSVHVNTQLFEPTASPPIVFPSFLQVPAIPHMFVLKSRD